LTRGSLFAFSSSIVIPTEGGTMRAAVRELGDLFDDVDMHVEPGRNLRAIATWPADDALQEVPLVKGCPDRLGDTYRRSLRAYQARGHSLQYDGIRDGDYIIVDTGKPIQSGSVVLAHVGQSLGVARVSANADGTLDLAPASTDVLPFVRPACEARIVGVLAGVIRKRGFAPRRRIDEPGNIAESVPRITPSLTAPQCTNSTAPAKLTILRGRLGMLERTSASTSNPRLRRALHNEADRVRRLLQTETAALRRLNKQR
jgi:hypothetical protein